MDKYCSENVRIIFSIIFTLAFLVGSTFLWKRLNSNYEMADNFLNKNTEVLLLEDVLVCNSDNYYGSSYAFTISSRYRENKNYQIKLMNDKINNQDIHYIIDNSSAKVLSDDGVVMTGDISPSEQQSYQIVIWLSNDYNDNDLNLVVEFL